MEGEEADPRGVHPAVPASPAAHPPHQREYESKNELFYGILGLDRSELLITHQSTRTKL